MISRAWTWLRAHPVVPVAILCGVAGFTTGRFTAPSKIEWQKTIEFREVASKKTEAGPTKKTARVVSEVLPGGGRRTTTDYVLEKGPVVTLENRTTESKSVEAKVTTWEAPRLTIGPTFGMSNLTPTYGGFITYRIAGPLVLMGQGEGGAGTWSARAGIGLNF